MVLSHYNDMPEVVTEKEVVQELKEIKKVVVTMKEEVDFIKNHMFDPDVIMTREESKRFEESMKELKEGKATPLSEFKKELAL